MPVSRGFDEFFGFLSGGMDHYTQNQEGKSKTCTVQGATGNITFNRTDYWQESTANGSYSGKAVANCSVDRHSLQGSPCPMALIDEQTNPGLALANCRAGKYKNCVAHGESCLQCKPKRYTAFDFTKVAVQNILTHTEKHPDKRLFMYLSLHNTHSPLEAPADFVGLYDFPVDNNPKHAHLPESFRNAHNIWSGIVSTVDSTVANVTAALKSSGLWNETWFVWMCDNGSPDIGGSNYPLRGAKGSDFEGGTRVPAFLSGGLPAMALMAGRSLDGIVAIADMYATVLTLAGLDITDPNPGSVSSVDGVSQWSYFTGKYGVSNRSEYVYDHLMYNATILGEEPAACGSIRPNGVKMVSVEPCFGGGAIRVGNWKLLHGTFGFAGHYGRFCPNASTDLKMLQDLPTLCSTESPCLFNVGTGEDEAENQNVAAMHVAVVKRLYERFRSYDDKYHPSSKPVPNENAQMCQSALNHGGWVVPFK